jgi:geranylgeranyl diphosphate synthase type I
MSFKMTLKEYRRNLLPEIDDGLRKAINLTNEEGQEDLFKMLNHHMGWVDENSTQSISGKRIRPLILLITTSSLGAEWSMALNAAVSIELVHNFSLIHDDIQDRSELRRGRPTIWSIWGIPQAINTGDTLFALAQIKMLELAHYIEDDLALKASKILLEASYRLTQGQHLDIAYEDRSEMKIDTYWKMIGFKTAELIAAATEIGSVCGKANNDQIRLYREFGYNLGMAFQITDDYLGIWGDRVSTGKSVRSDLMAGKKSLPIIYGIEKGGNFAKKWNQGRITSEDVPGLVKELDNEGAKEFTLLEARKYTIKATEALDAVNPEPNAGSALRELTTELLERDS